MKKEINLRQFQYWGVVSRFIIKNQSLNRADLELLLYLEPLEYFLAPEFKDGTLIYSWDPKRFYRLQNDGWIGKLNSKYRGHYKYTCTVKTKQVLKRIGRLLEGKEDIPENHRKENLYIEVIKKFNRKKQ